MGLFSRRKDAPTLSERDALAGVAISAMYADGVLDANEDADLVELLGALEAFAGAGDEGVRDVLVRVNELSAHMGDGPFLDACCAALPSALRPTAYAIAADILGADGSVAVDERGFAARLQKRLGLTDAECAAIRGAL